MGKVRRGRNQRKDVRIITQEWVENNCVNVMPRDIEMLKLLARFPLMNSEHLYTLTPGAGDQAPFHQLSQGRKRCNDRIRALFDMHCVNKSSPRVPHGEGTSKQYVWLDRAGVKLLDLDRRTRNDLPQDYKHRSLILDVYCELVQGQRNGDWEILYMEPERAADTCDLIPDITVLLRCGKKGSLLFLEVDRSEKKESIEKRKLQSYRDWELSKAWFNEPWCKLLPKPIFPKVAYLFDESKSRWKRRKTILKKHTDHIGLKTTMMGLSEFPEYIHNELKDTK